MTESISNPKYALGADATEQTRQRRRADMLGMEYLPSLQSGMAVLDVGCGVGATTQLVARQVHPGTVVGVDKEPRLISQATKDAQDLDLHNLEYNTGDASRLPLNSESFDLVYSRFLLAWVDDPQQAVREQIRTTICYNNRNVKIAGAHAGISVGQDGATHQALEDIAITRVLPNMTVIVPCDSIETEKATIAAAGMEGPMYIRFSRSESHVITTKK
ncbi:MAG: methyltransferase domain-containing protein, partial [Chloroflexi bacterium]|nr:methyltransferase domain-containing protein [Chloroflexota bacterium]